MFACHASSLRELQDEDIGELWRRYRPLQGKDAVADLALALIRKLVVSQASASHMVGGMKG